MHYSKTNLDEILRELSPVAHHGEYVFCQVSSLDNIPLGEVVGTFREQEGITVILAREVADRLGLQYNTTLGWITLQVHSSLEAIGLTATFSAALSEAGISCNVVAGYFHDHIFVALNETSRALEILTNLK